MRTLLRLADAPPPQAVLAALPAGVAPALLDTSVGGCTLLAWNPDRRLQGVLEPGQPVKGPRPWPLALRDPAAEWERACAEEDWHLEEDLPLGGGWIGWLGFECGHAYERFPWARPASLDLPDWSVARYPHGLLWEADGAVRVLWTEGAEAASAAAWEAECRALLARAAAARAEARVDGSLELQPAAGAEARYLDGVRALREWIAAGELYQANLSHRLQAEWRGEPRQLYARLRARQPTAMSAYWEEADGRALISHSPERFLRIDGETLESRPIKGTAARGADATADAAASAALEASEKERAELTMIVDMARNDLGRVAEPGAVEVPSLGEIEAFPTLFHRTATVRARWRPEQGLGALLAASFPPASVTGAPKVRALRAISELEGEARGPYCGALGWWRPGVRPQGDFSVLIRTAVAAHGRLSLSVGAGIVWDSDPRREWEETLLKGRYLVRA